MGPVSMCTFLDICKCKYDLEKNLGTKAKLCIKLIIRNIPLERILV